MAKVLILGANGYIGRRLIATLLEEGHELVALVRNASKCRPWPSSPEGRGSLSVIEADALKPETLKVIPEDIEAAYYLIHSMSDSATFAELEKTSASNIAKRLSETQASQIIYLGGISNAQELSTHLKSRSEVELELKKSEKPLTVLRAAIIIGSGSASFEIIRDLVEKLPVMITPKWLNTRCQPIAIRDAVAYLQGVLLKSEAYGEVFDIGGQEILTYKEMLLRCARHRGLRRLIVPVPVLSPRLSSFWLTLVTSVPFALAKSLVDSLSNEVIVKKTGIERVVPHEPLSYDKALSLAFDKIQTNHVLSSWNDGYDTRTTLSRSAFHTPNHGCFKDVRRCGIADSIEATTTRMFQLGGERGWHGGEWLWELRGLLDKCVGGVGLRRGRRNPDDLEEGDILDFWRVMIADRDNHRLLLYAEMKLPGEAWLEFKCVREDGRDMLVQVATFRPQGLLGRLYWYSVLPFHHLIFPKLARRLARAK